MPGKRTTWQGPYAEQAAFEQCYRFVMPPWINLLPNPGYDLAVQRVANEDLRANTHPQQAALQETWKPLLFGAIGFLPAVVFPIMPAYHSHVQTMNPQVGCPCPSLFNSEPYDAWTSRHSTTCKGNYKGNTTLRNTPHACCLNFEFSDMHIVLRVRSCVIRWPLLSHLISQLFHSCMIR